MNNLSDSIPPTQANESNFQEPAIELTNQTD